MKRTASIDQLDSASKVKFKNGQLKLKGVLDESDEQQFYQFKLGKHSNVDCTLSRQPGNVELKLLNRQGKTIAKSNESDGEAESIFKSLKKGVYYISLQQISGLIEYKLKSSVFKDVGSTAKKALDISSSKQLKDDKFSYKGFIGGSKDAKVDYYSFQLNETTVFSSVLQNINVDVDYVILNGNQKKVYSSIDDDDSTKFIARPLQEGVYYIKIKGNGKSQSSYELDCDFDDVESTKFVTDDVTGNSVFSKKIKGLDSAYYQIDLEDASNLELLLSNLSGDCTLELLSEEGSVLFTSKNPKTKQELINYNLDLGTYFVHVYSETNITLDLDLDFTISTPDDDAFTNTATLANGYRITFLGADYGTSTSTWNYYLEELPTSEDLSNWVVELPDCAELLTSVPGGSLVTATSSKSLSGVKWDTDELFTEGKFSFTLSGDVKSDIVDISATGDGTSFGQIIGPVCCECDDSIDGDDDDDDDDDDDGDDD